MTRAWYGTALLAGSWLLGLDYFSPSHPWAWCVTLFLAVVLLSPISIHWPSRRQQQLAFLVLLPAIWFFVFPYRAIPILCAVGLGMQLVPMPREWPRKLGRGAFVAGTILFAQAVALGVYVFLTARCHELPRLLAWLSHFLLNLVGVDAAVVDSTIGLRCAGDLLRFSATWELFLDPATYVFVIGGIALLAIEYYGIPQPHERFPSWLRKVLILLIITALWIPIRLVLLLSLVLQQSLRANIDTAPNIADILVNSWLHLVLVMILAWFVSQGVPAFFKRKQGSDSSPSHAERTERFGKYSLIYPLGVLMGTAILGTLVLWNPVGARKSGRIMIVERHSTWEPTTEPYATTIYGEAGSYNYAALYAYCEQYYDMSRLLEADPIDDRTLERCDVLVIKTPTARYSLKEVDAVVRFVKRGGSLLLVGDHTNVFNMNTYLNDIARHFGFTFRNDLLFRIGDPYKQHFNPPRLRHPILLRVPPMFFAVSCSIDPGSSCGTMVIRNTGLWSLPPAYQESNYHPQAEFRTPMQYGAWCQLWATNYGKGRILGFADSTIFSNFCLYQPGKAELMIGMLEWLNHASAFDQFGWESVIVMLCGLIGGILAILGWYLGWRYGVTWHLLLGALFCGLSATTWAVNRIHVETMPAPAKKQLMPHVVIDRTWSEVPLFTGAFSDNEKGTGYGMLEQWIPRIGNYISRQTGDAAFQGDGLVVICPSCSINRQRLDRLIDFVNDGGQLLVIDSPENIGSTANSILWPFGLASNHDTVENPDGKLLMRIPAGNQATDRKPGAAASDSPIRGAGTEEPPEDESPALPVLQLLRSCEITGGEILATWEGIAVAARAHHGKGTVVAIGFGGLFNDEAMGTHWLPEPEPDILNRYEVLYALLRASLPSMD